MKQVFNIAPQGNHDAARQALLIRIGERHFSFAITNNDSNELLQLTWYSLEGTGDLEFQEIYMKHPELRELYSRTIIGFDHPASVLIPYSAYKQIAARPVLETMYGVNGRHAVINEAVPNWQLYNVYAIPAYLQDWISRYFPKAIYQHNYSIGIKQIQTLDFDGSALLDFRMNDFSILLNRANKLLLAQTFPYSNPADVLFYLIKSCKEFSLAQESIQLSVSGLIEKESNLYRELIHYFINVQFREPGWTITSEQGYPAHFFTSLNDLTLCES